jgi:hypothetical protein
MHELRGGLTPSYESIFEELPLLPEDQLANLAAAIQREKESSKGQVERIEKSSRCESRGAA